MAALARTASGCSSTVNPVWNDFASDVSIGSSAAAVLFPGIQAGFLTVTIAGFRVRISADSKPKGILTMNVIQNLWAAG